MEFPNLVVILVEPEQPGNVGFVTRVLANFGVQELRIVGWDPREDMIAQIDTSRCIGCGVCVHHCPENAMNLKYTGLRNVFILPPKLKT